CLLSQTFAYLILFLRFNDIDNFFRIQKTSKTSLFTLVFEVHIILISTYHCHRTFYMFHHFMADTSKNHFLKSIQATTSEDELCDWPIIYIFNNFLTWLSTSYCNLRGHTRFISNFYRWIDFLFPF